MALQHVMPFLGKWTRQSIPDLTGKVAVVSGFNSGLGFETTRTLLEHNAEVGQCN
jgi:protochlorophyllide reductase